MEVTVIIPTLAGDSPALRLAIDALARQRTSPARVIVSIDHDDAPAPPLDVLTRSGVRAETLRGPNAGPGEARNRALNATTGDLVLFLNDDVVPDQRCIERHVAAHEGSGRSCLVVGDAEWWFPDVRARVIDRVVRETSMIFFYDRMRREPEREDWGFRHAWTLNLSIPLLCCPRFDPRLRFPMFDDLEWAHRCTRDGTAVRFAPDARVEHRHAPRYTPDTLVDREALLGHQAHLLRDIAPGCYTNTLAGSAMQEDLDIDAARRSLASFRSLSMAVDDDIDAQRVFEACRPWRTAARRVGWRCAESGSDVNDAKRNAREILGVQSASGSVPGA